MYSNPRSITQRLTSPACRVAVLDPRLNNGLLITATAFARRVIEVVRGT
ncbi:hypothetical protein [Rhodococcus qingshengii]|nr:hypothetical protein PI247_31350 [Rhodococcus qingshengii]